MTPEEVIAKLARLYDEKLGWISPDVFITTAERSGLIIELGELILHKVANMRRVGGAYWMLLSRPGLISAIYAVYDRIVDNFDDENIYIQSIYFLLRAIMKVRSEEIDKDFEKEKNKNE